MRCLAARSRTLALMALAIVPWMTRTSAPGQEANPTAGGGPNAKQEKRIEDLDRTIAQHVQAGRIAEAIPPSQEKRDLLVRLRGKDHWQAGDARRDLETYERLAARPREVRDRFAEALRLATSAGRLYGEGHYDRASEDFRKADAIYREVLGEGHPETATSLGNLANALLAQGQYAEAEAMFRRALAIRLKALGADHPMTATGYNDLAAALHALGRYPEAEAMNRRALAVRLKALGADHPLTASSYTDLAETLRSEGKSTEAEAMNRLGLAIRLKTLGEAHPDTAITYNNLAAILLDQGRAAEAEATHRRALAIRLKVLGEDHPDTALTYNNLAAVLDTEGKYAEAEAMHRRALAIRLKALGEAHPDTARSCNNLASALHAQGKDAEAEVMLRRALAIRIRALGENHPATALGHNNLATILAAQGKFAEAEAMHRHALAIHVKTLGESHPDTAFSYDSVGSTLRDQGKIAEAEAMHRRALAIRLATIGEVNLDTARSYNNVASTLGDRGKVAEAEAMDRRALAIYLKVLGEGHPITAHSYNNLAANLAGQGKYAEAEAMHRRALAIRLRALGEDHRDTAMSYYNLAATLLDEGNSAEAEAMHRRALAIRQKALGEDHPDTAQSYNNLAATLLAEGKADEAEAMHRRALAIDLKSLGERHSQTAVSYHNLAAALRARGKLAEAEAMFRRALAIFVEALGEAHPRTVTNDNNLANTLELQGRHEEALRTWRLAAAAYEQSRLLRPGGLEAALAEGSPLPGLAVALARAGRPLEAWESWERGLARGIVDELARRATRPLTAEESDREADLLGRGQAIDERINRMLGARALTQEQEKALDDLRRQASEIRRELLDLERRFEEKYGALASRPATLEAVRKALPEGTAIIGWIDAESGHWACVLGHAGDPAWVRLAGSGKDGAWTKEEEGLAQALRSQLKPGAARSKAGPLAESLARQRLDPLRGHLAGVRRLIVVNSPGLAGVPVEVLMAARPDPAWDAITVSYAPSAAMFAYLVDRPAPRDRPATLLALADPAYPLPKDGPPAPQPPTSGLALARVVPNGNADLNGLRAGDILLSYAGTELKQAGDLKAVASDGGPRRVPVRYWREGITREAELAAGRLGVVIDPRTASEFVRARREAERISLGMRGESHARLPGTRREVEALSSLFPGGEATTLLGARACESAVQGLARSGKLKGYRYLHFATHGRSDPRFAYRTALILAPDPDGSADPSALETDGTITAEQIARTWELDADLVVLSACESGLGRDAGGEGYLGFAQPLFARGARSLVLSQWKVDDDATALLMERFYRNLLGRRPGLSAPMPKAEALAEAKRWLRGADRSEVGSALAALPRGELVRREPVEAEAPAHPYADPIFWAAFVLVGAPD